MQMPVSEIIISKRVRQDLGDLQSLMDSLQKYGQLNPIIVTRDKELIAGHRRLESAKRLGWYTVDVVSVDRVTEAEKLEMELEENVHRKDLSPTELLEGYSRLERLLKPGFFRRVGSFFGGFFSRLFGRRKRKSPEAGQPESQESAPTTTPINVDTYPREIDEVPLDSTRGDEYGI